MWLDQGSTHYNFPLIFFEPRETAICNKQIKYLNNKHFLRGDWLRHVYVERELFFVVTYITIQIALKHIRYSRWRHHRDTWNDINNSNGVCFPKSNSKNGTKIQNIWRNIFKLCYYMQTLGQIWAPSRFLWSKQGWVRKKSQEGMVGWVGGQSTNFGIFS